jgi:hypothetical protein
MYEVLVEGRIPYITILEEEGDANIYIMLLCNNSGATITHIM